MLFHNTLKQHCSKQYTPAIHYLKAFQPACISTATHRRSPLFYNAIENFLRFNYKYYKPFKPHF